MTGCCTPSDYGRIFDAREARRYAQQYRKHGLDPVARRMVAFLKARGLEGATVLEVGGGIGAIQVESLQAGAARAINIELSPAYEEPARALLAEHGLIDRVDRRILDFATGAGAVDAADVVVMHRVVCCYPDMTRLVDAAAGRARRLLALSFPRDGWWVRLGIWAGNLVNRVRRENFRAYLHPPGAILATASAAGLHPVLDHRGWFWQLAVLERRGA